MFFAGDFLARCLLSGFPAFLRACSRFDLVRFRPSYDHDRICSRLVNAIQTTTTRHIFVAGLVVAAHVWLRLRRVDGHRSVAGFDDGTDVRIKLQSVDRKREVAVRVAVSYVRV